MSVRFQGSQFRIPTRTMGEHIRHSADVHMIFALDHQNRDPQKKIHPNLLSFRDRYPQQDGRPGEIYYDFTDPDPARAERFHRQLQSRGIAHEFHPDPAQDFGPARKQVAREMKEAERQEQSLQRARKRRERQHKIDVLLTRLFAFLR